MTERAVRWGILGTGGIAAAFAADLRRVPDARLTAVGSRAPGTAAAFARRYGAERAHGSWAALAADDEVDVVYVAVPHAAHHAAASACLAGGRAVLVEKPLTLDLASAADLVQQARTRGLFLMEAMWMRCNPLVRRAAELVADGAIGRVVAVAADFGLAGPFPPGHRLRDPAQGGGALLDLGVYPLHLAHLLLGVPDAVHAWARLTPEGVDELTGVLLGWESGAVATLHCGLTGAGRTGAQITGERGRIELAPPFYATGELTLHRAGGAVQTLRSPLPGGGYQVEAAEVQRCLRAGEPESPLVPHTATLEVMNLLDAVRERIGVVYPPP